MNKIKPLITSNIDRSWVTVGSFDGVHLGHQALVRELAARAHAAGEKAVVITFSPNPAVFFKRAPLAYNLCSVEQREKLLIEQGVDQVITIEFDENIAALTAEQFMQQVKQSLGITHLLVGSNFALGRGRGGDVPALQEIGKQMGYIVEITPPVKVDGEVISSSQIRGLLQEGKLDLANLLLGRAYSLEGNVVHGEHRGNKLGFPTANLEIAGNRLLPAKGVYACRAKVEGMVYTAVTNIGVRPTFENPLPSPRVEPHLLDLAKDLYGHYMELELIQYLRPEKAFDSPQDLIAQVNRDVQKTRELIDHDR